MAAFVFPASLVRPRYAKEDAPMATPISTLRSLAAWIFRGRSGRTSAINSTLESVGTNRILLKAPRPRPARTATESGAAAFFARFSGAEGSASPLPATPNFDPLDKQPNFDPEVFVRRLLENISNPNRPDQLARARKVGPEPKGGGSAIFFSQTPRRKPTTVDSGASSPSSLPRPATARGTQQDMTNREAAATRKALCADICHECGAGADRHRCEGTPEGLLALADHYERFAAAQVAGGEVGEIGYEKAWSILTAESLRHKAVALSTALDEARRSRLFP